MKTKFPPLCGAEPLKEPETPDVKGSQAFLEKFAENRAEVEAFEECKKKLKDKGK